MLLYSLNSIHAVPSTGFGELATSGAERYLPACQANVASLATLVPTDQYYRVRPSTLLCELRPDNLDNYDSIPICGQDRYRPSLITSS